MTSNLDWIFTKTVSALKANKNFLILVVHLVESHARNLDWILYLNCISFEGKQESLDTGCFLVESRER